MPKPSDAEVALSEQTLEADRQYARDNYARMDEDSPWNPDQAIPGLIVYGINYGRRQERERIAAALGMDLAQLVDRMVEVELVSERPPASPAPTA